jgi:hypothetical protein
MQTFRIFGAGFTFKQLLLIVAGTIVVLLVIGYGIFEARRILEGPRITLTYPIDGSAVGGPVVTVKGTVKNAAFITLNDRQILTDDKGNFEEKFSPPPGLAIIEVAARDRFGRAIDKQLQINVLAQCIEGSVAER